MQDTTTEWQYKTHILENYYKANWTFGCYLFAHFNAQLKCNLPITNETEQYVDKDMWLYIQRVYATHLFLLAGIHSHRYSQHGLIVN